LKLVAELRLRKGSSTKSQFFYTLVVDGKETDAGLYVSVWSDSVSVEWTKNLMDTYHKIVGARGENIKSATPGLFRRGK
jgi:hypothetical protein